MYFATFELIERRGRRYNFSLVEPSEYIVDDDNITSFDVSAVNIEENGNRSPIQYVLPPGIVQELDNTTTTQRQQNEQSLVLKVCNLNDGDSRATYKTTEIDLRTYKIKMFVHAEGEEDNLNNGDLSCFLRLGTDFTSNYYEYEIPLKATPHGATNANEIWPYENEIDIAFSILQETKKKEIFSNSSQTSPFTKNINGARSYSCRKPNLAQGLRQL